MPLFKHWNPDSSRAPPAYRVVASIDIVAEVIGTVAFVLLIVHQAIMRVLR